MCISRGTFPNCAIPMFPCWTCSPCCSAADAARACIRKCAKDRASCITSMRGLTVPAAPDLFGISAMVDARQIRRRARRDARRNRKDKIHVRLRRRSAEGGEAIHLRHACPRAKPWKARRRISAASWLAANDLNFSERYLAAVKRVTHAGRPARRPRISHGGKPHALRLVAQRHRARKSHGDVETNADQPIQKFELPNGLRLAREGKSSPAVRGISRGVSKAACWPKPPRTTASRNCSPRCCSKARRRAPRKKSRREIESVGGHIDSYGGNNSFGVNAEVLSSDFATGLDLLADVLLNPIFPADALEREREVQIAGIHAQKDNLLKSASSRDAPHFVRRRRLRPGHARHGRKRRPNCRPPT